MLVAACDTGSFRTAAAAAAFAAASGLSIPPRSWQQQARRQVGGVGDAAAAGKSHGHLPRPEHHHICCTSGRGGSRRLLTASGNLACDDGVGTDLGVFLRAGIVGVVVAVGSSNWSSSSSRRRARLAWPVGLPRTHRRSCGRHVGVHSHGHIGHGGRQEQ